MKKSEGAAAVLALILFFVVEASVGNRVLADTPSSGTFWSMQNTNWPPLPWNPFPDADVYALGSNNFAYNDLAVDYVQMREDAEAAQFEASFSRMMSESSEPPPSPGGTNDGG